MIVPLVPILIDRSALAPVSGTMAALIGAAGLALGGGGVRLYRLARPKLASRYRA